MMERLINAYIDGIIAILGYLTSADLIPLFLITLGVAWILGWIALLIYLLPIWMVIAGIGHVMAWILALVRGRS